MQIDGLDVVYVCKESPTNEELRYSLRSLKNLVGIRKVWIFGYAQPWLDNVEYVPIEQHEGNKWLNAAKQIKAICDNNNITKDFILFNDDFFVCKKTDKIPAYFDRTLSARIGDFLKAYKWNAWSTYARRLKVAKQELQKRGYTSYNFETHYPMVFNREKLARICEEYGEFGCKRSFYGNIYNPPREQASDCKLYHINDKPTGKERFLSSMDTTFKSGEIGNYIKKKFNKPCKYEKEVVWQKTKM